MPSIMIVVALLVLLPLAKPILDGGATWQDVSTDNPVGVHPLSDEILLSVSTPKASRVWTLYQ